MFDCGYLSNGFKHSFSKCSRTISDNYPRTSHSFYLVFSSALTTTPAGAAVGSPPFYDQEARFPRRGTSIVMDTFDDTFTCIEKGVLLPVR